MFISHLTSKGADNKTFFTAGKSSPWYVVAFGMVGVLLSGVTFLSVPGWIKGSQFSYLQFVLGNVVGYWLIVGILLPLYYKMNLTSIYEYLGVRFGPKARKTGSFFFLLSRTVGASFRLFLVAIVLHELVAKDYGVNFSITVAVTIVLIWVYTYRGGIKTVVWTDILQTSFMLIALVTFLIWVSGELGGASSAIEEISKEGLTKTFFFEWSANGFFQKFLSGIFIALVMNGLDQDMMQKTLTCKNLSDAKKNVMSLSVVFLLINILFMILGAMLTVYAESKGLDVKGDTLFLGVAKNAPIILFVLFLLGVIAAAYSSADSALTSLTTAFCVDFMNLENRIASENESIRKKVHILFSLILFAVILTFKGINDKSVVENIFTAAGFTYGPLLGFFAFGMLTKLKVSDRAIPIIGVTCPVISYFLMINSEELLGY
ncbi:MAG: sodium:solute symporter, partial [Lentisphaeraceae bacterium]|nr:sodium:solute symporter [Lentisphaeraceae bacterium]